MKSWLDQIYPSRSVETKPCSLASPSDHAQCQTPFATTLAMAVARFSRAGSSKARLVGSRRLHWRHHRSATVERQNLPKRRTIGGKPFHDSWAKLRNMPLLEVLSRKVVSTRFCGSDTERFSPLNLCVNSLNSFLVFLHFCASARHRLQIGVRWAQFQRRLYCWLFRGICGFQMAI